jgi:hypothetical protein
MQMWTDEFGSVFFLSIATILTGSFGLVIRYCLRSKCEHIKCCCVEVDRRVDIEANIEMEEHKHVDEKKSEDV